MRSDIVQPGSRTPEDGSRRLRVMLISEGNYPYHWGGVSTWCHILVNELKEIDFVQYSIIDDASLPLKFTLPENVVEFRDQPLWGMHQVLETRKKLNAGELLSIWRRTTPVVIEETFLPYFRAFVTNLFTGNEPATVQADLLHHMHRFFLEYDYDATMRSRIVWQCFMETILKYGPPAMAERGYTSETISLAEATKAMQWLFHWLIPLARPIPKVDVAHAAMAGICTLVAVMAKLEHGAAFLLTEHGVYLRERYFFEAEKSSSLFLKCFSLFFSLRMTELSYTLADLITPCCNFNQRWELRNGADPRFLKTIYYGVDSSKFSPSGRPPNDPLVVVWMGRIDPLKDLFTLLHAAALVHKAQPKIQFRLFGSAPPGNESYYEKCLALWRELGLEQTVVFAGFRSDTNNAYNEGDIFVLTSKSEAFPFVNLEALLCERPVVSSAVGGVPEQLEGCGFAVEPRNPQALADAILQLAADPELRAAFGREGRRKVVTDFSIELFSNLYAQVYQQLVRQTQTPQETKEEDSSHPLQIPILHRIFQEPKDGINTVRAHSENQISSGRDKVNGHKNGKGLSARPDDPSIRSDAYKPHSQVERMGTAWLPEPSRSRVSSLNVGEGQIDRYISVEKPQNYFQVNSSPNLPDKERNSRKAEAVIPLHEITELVDEVLERDPKPIDALEVTALLEAQGITDQVALQKYGYHNSFDLGEAVLAHMREAIIPKRLPKKESLPEESLREKWSDFGRGPLSLVPVFLVILIISVLTNLSGWKFPMVMAFSLGLTCSMIVNSGLLHVVGRRISIYLGMRNEKMARLFLIKATTMFLGIDLVMAVVVTLILLLPRIFTTTQSTVFFIAFAGMACLWLLGGELAMIGKVWWLGLSQVVGILVGAITGQLIILISYRVPYLSGQYLFWGCGVGYLTSIGLLAYAINRSFTGPQSRLQAGEKHRLPSLAFLVSESIPYFLYGTLYMIFILTPHLLGFSGRLPAGIDRVTGFTQLELVFTLAMLPISITSGINERALRLFWKLAPKALYSSPINSMGTLQQKLERFADYNRKKYFIWLSVTSLYFDAVILMILLVPAVSTWLQTNKPWEIIILFQIALVTFWLIGMAMYNIIYCLTLGSPWAAVKPEVYGLLTILLTGIPSSIVADYRFCAVAFLLGAIILYIGSRKHLRATLEGSPYNFTFLI